MEKIGFHAICEGYPYKTAMSHIFNGSACSEHDQSHESKSQPAILLLISVLFKANNFLITEYVAGYIHDHPSVVKVVGYIMGVSQYGYNVQHIIKYIDIIIH